MSETPDSNRQTSAPNFSEVKSRGFKSRRMATVRRYVLLVGFGILMALLGALTFNILSDPVNNPTSNEAKSVLSTDEMRDYTPPNGEFTVKLPGVPVVSEKTSDENGNTIPLTAYERKIENDAVTYTIEVYDYTGRDIDHKQVLKSKLSSKVNSSNQNTLQSSSVSNHNGTTSIEAYYSASNDNSSANVHTKLQTHGSKVYVLTLTGADQTKFNQFADSLKFND